MNRVDEMVSDLLHVLELAGVLLAVLVVLGLLVGLLRSLVQVSLGRSTLVLPFSGGESAAWVADVLAEQLDQVENRVVEKHKEVRDAEALAQGSTTRVQLGPAVRFLPEQPGLALPARQRLWWGPAANLSLRPLRRRASGGHVAGHRLAGASRGLTR